MNDIRDIVYSLEKEVRDSGFSMRQVCKKAGVAASTVSRWKKRGANYKGNTVKELQVALEKLKHEKERPHNA